MGVGLKMKKRSFMTCETTEPQKWAICVDGETQTTSQVCYLLLEQQDKLLEVEQTLKTLYAGEKTAFGKSKIREIAAQLGVEL